MMQLYPAIPIKYDGLDASQHLIDMAELGTSISGINRIIRDSVSFAIYNNTLRRNDGLVRIYIRPLKEGSVFAEAVAIASTQYPLLVEASKSIGFKLTGSIISATLLSGSGRKKDMDRAFDVIEKLVEQQGASEKESRSQLVGIIHKLVESNQPSVRNAIKPIGNTCGSLQIGDFDDVDTNIDLATKDSIMSGSKTEVGSLQDYIVSLDGVTLHNKTCKIVSDSFGDKPINCKITDPVILCSENIYTEALHKGARLRVTAKPLLKDDKVHMLYISNAERYGP